MIVLSLLLSKVFGKTGSYKDLRLEYNLLLMLPVLPVQVLMILLWPLKLIRVLALCLFQMPQWRLGQTIGCILGDLLRGTIMQANSTEIKVKIG